MRPLALVRTGYATKKSSDSTIRDMYEPPRMTSGLALSWWHRRQRARVSRRCRVESLSAVMSDWPVRAVLLVVVGQTVRAEPEGRGAWRVLQAGW